MLPRKFTERMKLILGDEYPAFADALENGEAVRGFRVNTLKCSADDFARLDLIPRSALGYSDTGFILGDTEVPIGNTPAHAAGMIYCQDPGAMASLEAIDITPGMKVLDLCAAPGGKSTQAAAKLSGEGFILSNEYVPKRAKILVGNFERMGIRCGMVTSLDTSEIAKLFGSYFDVVIVDAPCSGEGMFRKDVPAIEEWSEENVAACRERQLEILENAIKTLKVGGRLLYSTCTYSVDENEGVVDEILARHPELRLTEVKERVKAVTADGISFFGARSDELYKCRRFYPHKAPGEGQFFAVLEKIEGDMPTILYKDSTKAPSKDILRLVEAFFNENLKERPEGRIVMNGENLTLIPHGTPIPPRSVFCQGVLIGEVRGKNLFPSHQFYSAYGRSFLRQENLTDDALAYKYLRGEEIPSSFATSGICAVLYHGSPLGGGKASGGMIKNHYPKGLRINN